MQVSEQTRLKRVFIRHGLRMAHYNSNYPLGVVGEGLKPWFLDHPHPAKSGYQTQLVC